MEEKKDLNGSCIAESKRDDNSKIIDMSESREPREERKTVLLHSCCGPCSTSVIERLARDYNITVFFYNPNITDEEEYERRRDAQIQVIEKYNMSPESPDRIKLIEGPYEPKAFLNLAQGLEYEPEDGVRCSKCYRMRLEKTVEEASLGGYDFFTTTLTVSPHKNSTEIIKIGTGLAMRFGKSFLTEDFKKRDGFKRSVELSKAYGIYRQNYCGCEFSR